MNIGSEGKGQAFLKTLKRTLVVSASAFLVFLGVQGAAHAQSGVCSATNLAPGQTITVNGTTGPPLIPGATVTLLFSGGVIGATTADGFGNFSVSGTIPALTPPGVYAVRVDDGPGPPVLMCNVTVQGVAPTPTPVPTATPTPRPADDDLRDLIRALADRGGGGQQQQQEQQVVFPVAAPIPIPVRYGGGGSSLPKTGADVAEVGGLGTATLLAGVTLMEFARRRRRHWLAPAFAGHVATPAPVTSDPFVQTVAPPPIAPMPTGPGETEGDLLLPYSAALPPPTPVAPADFITPTF